MKAEHVRDQVIGLLPVYYEGGNSTRVFLDRGQVFVDRRTLRSVVKALARCYAVDLKAQRELLRDRIGKKAVLPFFLENERVFIPLKMRQALTKNDATYGYVDVGYLQEVVPEKRKKCRVKLLNGLEFEVFSNRATAVQSLHTGKQLLASLRENKKGGNGGEEIVESARVLARALEKISRQLDRIEEKIK